MPGNGNGHTPFEPITRQNSFLSPLDSNYSKRASISSRSSLVRSPDRISNKDNKRRRLSLLPSNGGSLGAPRLLHQRPPTITNFTNNLTSTQSSIRNSSSNIPVQQMIQNSISRTRLPINRNNDKFSRPPSSGRYDTPPVSTSRLYSKPKSIDPRPLRSHKYQAKLQEELYQYLSTHKFDIEMKTQISPRILKAPAQKDFVLIFQWLYKQLDPGYKFNRSIEQDVYMLLKFLEYPYLENINKSQISAVGGENWHTFLGMLHWLMELVKESIKLDDLDLDSIQDSQSFPQPEFSDSQSVLNKLFINYALKSYKAFLTDGDEDYSDFYDEMQSEYRKYIEQIERQNVSNIEINENLQGILNNLNERYSMFQQHLEKGAALRTDVKKFRDYIETQKRRQLQWPGVINRIKADIESLKDSIKNLTKEKNEYITDLERKHLTLNDIEDLHKERARLTSDLNNLDQKQQATRKSIDSRLQNLTTLFNDLKIKVNAYNNEMYSILNDINLQLSPDVSKLIIGSLDDDLLNSKLGLHANDIIPILPTLRTELSDLKNKIQNNLNTTQEDVMKLQNQLSDLELTISSDMDKLDELEESLSVSKKDLSDLKDNFKSETVNLDLEIQERAKEISLFKLQATERKKTIESKWKETQRTYKATITEIQEQRKQLTFKITSCLDNVVNFKSEVFENLETAAFEAKNEVKEQIDTISKSSEVESQRNNPVDE